jgi:DNA-binding GntR family transcriptional regulator
MGRTTRRKLASTSRRPKAESGRRVSSETQAEKLRRTIEEMIVSGALQPGDRVDEADLAARFKVSRTPVREALKTLAATGLLEVRPRQGAVVARISIPVLLEMFQMMGALEGLCARLAARRATLPQKAALREVHERLIEALANGDPEQFYAINSEFHDLLYDAAHTHFLADQTRALRRRVSVYRRRVTHQPGRMAATIGEHERIIEAIERADGAAAFDAANEHVNLLGDNMADFIAMLQSGGGTAAAEDSA